MKKSLVTVQLADLKPYKRNARKNDATVPDLAEAMEQVGYITPIIADENNEILAGHTRLKALQLNGEKEVQVVRVTGLTAEQKRKFRIYDNKIGEKSEWDYDLLAGEILDLDFGNLADLIETGLNAHDQYAGYGESDDDDTYKEPPLSPKERFWEINNFKYYEDARMEGKYNFPTNKASQHWPTSLIGFHDVNDTPAQYKSGIHFYIHDYKFECLWNSPERYLDKFARYDCLIAPDFSTYTDMPLAHVIWNLYRNRLLVQIFQDYGIEVIPNIMWGTEETFEFCFDGLPKHSILAVESKGCVRDEGDKALWYKAMDNAIERLEPTGILLYGVDPGYNFKNVPVKLYRDTNDERFAAKRKPREGKNG